MADLKVGTTIGGSPAWHQGNLPLVPSGVKILYKGKRIYSEADKPTANELNVVSRDGDTMSQRLTIATTNDYPLAFNSTDSGPSKILFQRANTTRMVMGMDAAGNFQLSSNDASGTHIGYGLQIWNSSLDASFGGSIQMPDNKSWYIGKGRNPVLRDHNNGNVTLSALPKSDGNPGDLYLGWNGTNTVRLESALTWKSVRTLVNADGYVLRSAMDNPYFNQTESDNRFIRRNVNTVTDSYLLSKSVDYTDGSVSIPAGYSGFFRNNSSNDFRGLTIHVAHPSYSNGAYSRGITFDYGSGTSLYTYGFDSAGVKRSNIKIYTEADKPTPGELGALPATANAVSASKLATGRRISLSGDATGSVVFDGSGDVTLPVTVLNDSHTHNNYVVKAGDTMTGNLIVNAAISANELKAGSDTHKARIVHSGGAVWYQGGSIATDQPNNVAMSGYSGTNLDLFQIRMGDGRSPVVRWGSTDYRIYHEGNRPSELVSISLSGKSCNSAVESGTYSIFSGTTDTPFGTGPSGSTMQVSKWGDGGVQQMFFSYSSDRVFVRRLQGTEWKPWFELYSTAKKPTAADVGALSVNGNAVSATRLQTARLISGVPFDGTSNITLSAGNVGAVAKTGDTMTGMLTISNNTVLPLINPTPNAADLPVGIGLIETNEGSSGYDNYSTILNINRSGLNRQFQILAQSGGSKFKMRASHVNGSDTTTKWHPWHELYHTGFKPTAADVGAVAKTGDSMAGQLQLTATFNGTSTSAQIAHIGSDVSQALFIRNMREHNSAAWIWEKVQNGSLYYSIGINGGSKSKIRMGVTSGEIYLGNADKRVYHEGYETTPAKIGAYTKAETDGLLGAAGRKTVTVNKPSGIADGQYVPVVLTNLKNRENVYISTRSSGGSDPMNNCSFNGIVRSGGWGDYDSYVTGQFSIYSTAERALHSVQGGTEGDGFVAFYVHEKAFPITVVVDGEVDITAAATVNVGTTRFVGMASPIASSNTKATLLAQWADGAGFYQGSSRTPSNQTMNTELDKKLDKTGGTITGNLSVNTQLTVGNSVICGGVTSDSWLRTNGDNGWYSEKWGGGIHMSDNIWIRTYGNKKLYVSNTDANSINTSGGVAVAGNITIGGSSNSSFATITNGSNTILEFHTPGRSAAMIYKGPEGNLRFATSNGSGGETALRMQLDTGGNLALTGALNAGTNVTGNGVYDAGQRVYSAANPIPDGVILRSVVNGGGNMAIGSYAMVTVKSNLGPRGPGTVLQGTQIQFSNAEGTNFVPCNYGTWRLMGVSRAQSQNGDGWGSWNVTLAQRIT
ncbi:long tail fiber hinge connector [Aeromonas phage Asfd_1]|nr:long tail fiber hinge connector [Aeromonas phage Asfd_1]